MLPTKSDSLPGVQQANNYTAERGMLIIYFTLVPTWVLGGIPQVKHTPPDFLSPYLYTISELVTVRVCYACLVISKQGA